MIDTGGLDLETLDVLAASDFVALTFVRASGQRAVYVLQRDTARPGQWAAATIDGVQTKCDQPTLTYGTDAAFAGGATFFVVTQMDADTLKGSYDVLTWRWTEQAWTRETTQTPYVWVTAGEEYFAVLDTTGALSLHALDGILAWKTVGTATVTGLSTVDVGNVALAPGAGMLVVANLQSSNAQQNTYTLTIAAWDARYAIDLTPLGPFTDAWGSGGQPLPWVPRIVADTMIGSNGNLIRRTGGGWSVDTTLNPGSAVPNNTVQRYAFGPDFAIRVIDSLNGVGQPSATILAFDPTTPGLWGEPTSVPVALPVGSPNVPTTSGDDWATIGPFVYFRGTATDWASVLTAPPLADLRDVGGDGFMSDSMVNEGPEFLAYAVTGDDGARSAQAVMIHNGALAREPELTGETMHAASDGCTPGAGVSAQGPSVFVGYPSSAASLDAAGEVSLHRWAGNAVRGPIRHYTVTLAEIGEGLGAPVPTAFDPDTTTAGCDPSGNIVKFFQTTVYPGARDAGASTQGKVTTYFYNVLHAAEAGHEVYDMLDGMQIATETYADDQDAWVEREATTWTVLQRIASSPTDPGAPSIQLHGGWVAETQRTQVRDGVTTTTDTAYVPAGLSLPYCGSPTLQSRAQYGGSGEPETFQRSTRYGVEVDQALVAIHALSDVAQVTDTRSAGRTDTVLSSTATTFAPWPTAIDPELRVPAPNAQLVLLSIDNPAFPFRDHGATNVPPGWRLVGRTTERTRYGLPRETTDGLGVRTATVLAAGEAFPVATIVNATAAGCAYLGFAPYEDTSGWTLDGVVLDPQIAFAGTQSARLPGGASISVSVAPTAAATYVVGYRYRTPAGFTAQGGGVQATVTVDGAGQPPVSSAFACTDDAWTYATLAVPIPAGSARAMVVEVVNAGTADVHVDSILIAPLPSGANAQSFDPVSLQPLATMDGSGRTNLTAYDRSLQPTVTVGAGGLVSQITVGFVSRAGNAADRFDATSPSAQITLDTAAGGVLETFRDGDGWATRWSPSNPGAWSPSDGALVHGGTSRGSIVWQGDFGTDTRALYFEVAPGATPSITAGDVSIAWTGSAYTASQADAGWTALASPPALARHWLLVIGDGVVLFFADGQLLFSEKTQPVGSTLAIGAAAITLRNLTVVGQVRLGLAYLDGASRERQIHQLHGADSYVCENVYDDLGRQIAITKCAPGSFGAGATVPVMAYRQTFVDVPAFLAATGSTWAMTGDVASFWAGQTEGGVTRSDDQGYPYWGTRYEASPRSVRVEVGQPGKPYAIDLQVPPAQRSTMKLAFGTNPGPQPPAGQYREDRLTSTLGSQGTRVTDLFGQPVGASWRDPSGALQSRASCQRTYGAPSTGAVTTTTLQMPNALIAGPQSGDAGYVRTTTADAVQHTVSVTDSDAGQTSFVYDSAGHPRFVQPALDGGEAWFNYAKFDALGRTIEQGTIDGAWNPATLAYLADQPDYPSNGNAAVVTLYDGDGTVPALIGMKWQTTTENAAPDQAPGAGDCRVVETFAYDGSGNVVSVTQALSGAVVASATIGYAYDNIGEVVRIDMPSGAPIPAVHYARDDQGLVTAVGTSAGAADLGGFAYDPGGHLVAQSYGGGAWQRTFTYASPGWAVAIAAVSADGSRSARMTMDYDPDGMMLSRTVETSLGEPWSWADGFTYDSLRRLTAANGSSGVAYTSYDANGNPWTVVQAGGTTQLACAAGSNRLGTVTLPGAAPAPIAYDARGQVLSGLGKSFSYDRATATCTAISAGGNCIRIGYGGSQQRVLKQIVAGAGDSRVYFTGAGLVPVATLAGGAWAVGVQGPAGLLAYVSDRTYFPLADVTGSIWAVVDDRSVIGTSTYLPFGEAGRSTGSPERIPYRYQGQEWDDEVGLYNFRARMYDPVLRRFLAPDPRRQFVSPYVFAADAPLTVVDPTGQLAQWAVTASMVTLIVVGAALTVATMGGGAEIGALMMAEAGALEAGAAAAEGAAVVSSGVATAGSVAMGVTGSALLSAGLEGRSYQRSAGDDATLGGLAKAVGIGAAKGATTALVGGALGPYADAMVASQTSSAFAKAAGRALTGAIAYTIGTDLQTVLTNVGTAQPWYDGLRSSTATGAATGAVMGAGASLAGSGWSAVKQTDTYKVVSSALSGNYIPLIARNQSTIQLAFRYASPSFAMPTSFRA